MTFGGIPIVSSPLAVKAEEDWSKVRSPARARRRRRRGFRQNIVVVDRPAMFEIGGVLHVHPSIYRALLQESDADAQFLFGSRKP